MSKIVYFNYEIINEAFEDDKLWEVILKFTILTTSMLELTQIQI